jgi:ubiquinone/menaquinone biosynthesis C-methylase UbiE
MKMTAVEKHFVNSPGHARTVADRGLQLLSRVDPRKGWRYLDVGCGVGTAAREIAATGDLSVTGVDIDPAQIEIACRGAASANLQFKVMDASKLEFGDGQFDVVASHMATHHMPDWERAFSEMVRVLRTGGYLIYRDFLFPSWLAAMGRRLIRFMGFPSRSGLDSMAARLGLVEIYQSRQSGKLDAIWIKNG